MFVGSEFFLALTKVLPDSDGFWSVLDLWCSFWMLSLLVRYY